MKSKSTMLGVTALTSPTFLVLANQKGGVGKSLTATVAVALLDLHQRPFLVAQIDDQDRLEQTLRVPITTIRTENLKASRTDPGAGLRAFRPLMENLDRARKTGATLLLDVGATQVPSFMAFAALSEMDDDFVELGVRCRVLVPAVAEPEALTQAASTINAFKKTLPSAEIAFVENQRDGAFDDLVVGSDAQRILENELKDAAKGLPWLTMPAVDGKSWAYFERHHCRPLDVIQMDVPTVMRLTGLPRAEAKIARGDVAAWVAAMQNELLPILGLENGDVD